MEGDKVPTLLDPLVEWFEEWKSRKKKDEADIRTS